MVRRETYGRDARYGRDDDYFGPGQYRQRGEESDFQPGGGHGGYPERDRDPMARRWGRVREDDRPRRPYDSDAPRQWRDDEYARSPRDDDDDRARRGDWFDDPEGHSAPSRRGWRNR